MYYLKIPPLNKAFKFILNYVWLLWCFANSDKGQRPSCRALQQHQALLEPPLTHLTLVSTPPEQRELLTETAAWLSEKLHWFSEVIDIIKNFEAFQHSSLWRPGQVREGQRLLYLILSLPLGLETKSETFWWQTRTILNLFFSLFIDVFVLTHSQPPLTRTTTCLTSPVPQWLQTQSHS